MMLIVLGMCDSTTTTATTIVAVLWLWLLSLVVVVIIAIVLDRCTECVLEDLGQDIFHVYWDITEGFFLESVGDGYGNEDGNARESGVGRAVYYDGRGCAERRLAKLAHERAAHADHFDGGERHVDDAHISIRLFRVLQRMRKHDVLLRDQSDSDAITDGGVEEITDLFRGHVLCAFLKPEKSESQTGKK